MKNRTVVLHTVMAVGLLFWKSVPAPTSKPASAAEPSRSKQAAVVAPRVAAPLLTERKRTGRVRVLGHSLVDDGGPFLGLGVSYFTALWRSKHDRQRLESDLAFLSKQGFNYYRMLSMLGWNEYWDGSEIAPVAFTNRKGKPVPAWPDYWTQLRELIDIAYDRYGLRTQITIFADAQLIPGKPARIEHMRKLLTEVVPGREHKILLIEVANEAWQNGFPGDQGNSDLREFTRYLTDRTKVPVATTSNHEDSFTDLYKGSTADLATWHFSRERGPDDGWKPVYDCWSLGELRGLPPVISNEPIGPGASVNSETESIRLVSAAAFAYIAKLPSYVFHSQAGVLGKTRFEETPGISHFRSAMHLLPPDLPTWQRNDGKEPAAPFTAFTAGQPNHYWTELQNSRDDSRDGCVRNVGSRKGKQFICLPIGIRPDGLQLEAREKMHCRVYNPLTGELIIETTKQAGERLNLPTGPGAFIIQGTTLEGRIL